MELMPVVRLRKSLDKLLMLAIVFGLNAFAFAADTAGVIVKLKGDVKIERGKGAAAGAVEGDKFYVGDTFITGGDGRAKLRFAEGGPNGKNEVVISSASRLFIEKAGSAGSGKSGTSLALESGAIRSNVKKKYSGEGEDVFKVRTPNAVAGVRGTIFMMSFDSKTKVSALATQQGKVIFTMAGNSKAVSANQAIKGTPESPGKVEENRSPASVSKEFKELESEDSGSGDSSKSEGSKDSVVGEAPPAALDRETVKTEDRPADASETAKNPGDNSQGKGPGDKPANRAPAGDAPVAGTAPAPAPVSGGIMDSVVSAPPPTLLLNPITAPPPVYVPPVNPVTVEAVRSTETTGKVRIPIKDY
jgi:hypothetical protein